MNESNRLARIEKILRDYGLHEPDCPTRLRDKEQATTGRMLVRPDCTCWLTREAHP